MTTRIGLDLDGVIVDWDRGWREYWNQTHFTAEHVPPFSRTWEDPFNDTGMSHGDFWAWMDQCSVWDDLPPCEDALPALRQLKELGVEVHFITFRHHAARPATAAWLSDYGLGEHPLTFTKVKSHVKCDVYVDDNDDNLMELARNSGAHVIRRIRPWNYPIHGVIDLYDLTDLPGMLS